MKDYNKNGKNKSQSLTAGYFFHSVVLARYLYNNVVWE